MFVCAPITSASKIVKSYISVPSPPTSHKRITGFAGWVATGLGSISIVKEIVAKQVVFKSFSTRIKIVSGSVVLS